MLDDELVRAAMAYAKVRSKKALVEEALRTFVAVKEAELRRFSYAERLAGILARTRRLELRESAADLLRADRERAR